MSNTATLASPLTAFAADVRAGLTMPGQKELPSKYLYDAVGSRLFEVICELPEYGLTRADERLLRSHAHEIVEHVPGNVAVCELGSGNGKKTRWILEALVPRRRINYFPIEISAAALAICQRELADIESVGIVGLEREYLDGLREVAQAREPGQRLWVLFLGSTIGNFSSPADMHFLRDIRAILAPGDALLLGTDLQKPEAQLLAAYGDPIGVTAAFNLNLLARINRELAADFDLRWFVHRAKWNQATGSVEMHIQSLRRQTVTVGEADLRVDFEPGETIWTENSRKYSLAEVAALGDGAGFRREGQWMDIEWPFAETLLIR